MTGRGFSWSDEQTKVLIDIWGDQTIQSQLEGTTRNITVYRRMADCLNRELGLEDGVDGYKTGERCRVKVKNLKNEYKQIVDNNNRSGRGRKTCKHFDALDRILGTRPTTAPLNFIDTADDDQAGEEDEDDEYGNPGARGGDSESDYDTGSPTQSGRPITPASHNEEDVENDRQHTPVPRRRQESGGSRSAVKRKRKMTKAERAVESLICQFAESQKAASEVDERRMRIEIEMEQKRRESEERMREADRNHEMCMMQLMLQAIQSNPSRVHHPPYPWLWNVPTLPQPKLAAAFTRL